MSPHGGPEGEPVPSAALTARRHGTAVVSPSAGDGEDEHPGEGVELLSEVGVHAAGPRAIGVRGGGAAEPVASRTAQAGAAFGAASSADPVRRLLERHRGLCERAVDPLEIAAGLEAYGVTDRTAARFRHRDVFSLAEELYARAAHPNPEEPPPRARDQQRGRARLHRLAVEAVLPLLPAALGVLTLVVLARAAAAGSPYAGPVRFDVLIALAGAVAVLAAVRLAVRQLALPRAGWLAAAWLAGYALFGNALCAEVLGGGPDLPPEPLAAADGRIVCGLLLAFAPAVWCARWFSLAARRRLAASRSLGELAGRLRPLLAVAVLLFAAALAAVLFATAFVPASAGSSVVGASDGWADAADGWTRAAAGALAALFFAALLLASRGRQTAAVVGLGAAAGAEALCLAVVLAARLPYLGPLGRPVEQAVAVAGSAVVPLLACGIASAALLGYAARALVGAAVHHREVAP